tara:strand:+ start:27 stop:140 length:114 start_codon:yes stop_codon:yes gene_type:complete
VRSLQPCASQVVEAALLVDAAQDEALAAHVSQAQLAF